MPKFSEEILDTIRDRIDIVRFIGEYVPLKRAGRAFKGLCPFHKEKTPSFFVNPDRQIFKCFGCGESGNVFSFIMKFEGMDFHQAVERLASLAGVVLPEQSPFPDKYNRERERLYRVLNSAYRAFEDYLNDPETGLKARSYLERRGVPASLWKKIGLGFAPDSWDALYRNLLKKGFNLDELEKAGLVVKRPDTQGGYDRFRNRIIFPIREHRKGKVVAFGGRTLGDDPAKYINSPETPIYRKHSVLYGFWESVQAIRKNRTAIMVEGYFDRLALLKVGIENVVAPCGTTLTPQQTKLLKRAALKIVFLFDADAAGISAARRAMELCLSMGVETIAAPMPEGMDPDDVVRESGKDGISNIIENGVSALDFLLRHMSKIHDVSVSRGRRDIIEEFIPFLQSVQDSIDRGQYISHIAEMVHVPDQMILDLMMKNRPKRHRRLDRKTAPTMEKNEVLDPKERDLFLFLLENPSLIQFAEQRIPDEYMLSEPGLEIYRQLKKHATSSEIPTAKIVDSLSKESVKKTWVSIVMDPAKREKILPGKSKAVLTALESDFKKSFLKRKLWQNQSLIRKGKEEKKDISALLQERMSLMRDLSELNGV